MKIIPYSLDSYDLTSYEFIFTNENYLIENDTLIIYSEHKFFIDDDIEINSENNTNSLNKCFIIESTGSEVIQKKKDYKLFLKVKTENQLNKEIKIILNNINNPHSAKEINFQIKIYDSSLNYKVLDSNIQIPILIQSKINLLNLEVKRIENNTLNFKFKPTKLIESYDMFELKYEENKFGIYLSGPYCRNEIIKNLNNKFGCVINRENNSILFPWGYKVINGIFDSSYEIEFNLLNIYFKHTE